MQLLRLAAGIWLTACAGTASADFHRYRDVVVGERALGMAGAYTAIADDQSALHYNPGGLAFVTQRKISASVNA